MNMYMHKPLMSVPTCFCSLSIVCQNYFLSFSLYSTVGVERLISRCCIACTFQSRCCILTSHWFYCVDFLGQLAGEMTVPSLHINTGLSVNIKDYFISVNNISLTFFFLHPAHLSSLFPIVFNISFTPPFFIIMTWLTCTSSSTSFYCSSSLLLCAQCRDAVLWPSSGLSLYSSFAGGLPVCICALFLFGRLPWPCLCACTLLRTWVWLLSAAWRLHQPQPAQCPAAPSPQQSWAAAQGLLAAITTAWWVPVYTEARMV